jgi:CRISPR-associated endonuclease/helicase Cas3
MDYPLTAAQAGRNGDSLLNLLAHNPLNIGRTDNVLTLQQSFKTAGRLFQAIAAPPRSVLVPYGKGREIIAQLCAAFEPSKAHALLRQGQQYSVNVFPNIWKKLREADAIMPVQAGEDIWYLDEQFYSDDFGLSAEIVSKMETTII